MSACVCKGKRENGTQQEKQRKTGENEKVTREKGASDRASERASERERKKEKERCKEYLNSAYYNIQISIPITQR